MFDIAIDFCCLCEMGDDGLLFQTVSGNVCERSERKVLHKSFYATLASVATVLKSFVSEASRPDWEKHKRTANAMINECNESRTNFLWLIPFFCGERARAHFLSISLNDVLCPRNLAFLDI